MRRWYEMMMAERLAQLDHIIKSREMLRRGVRKLQDGTLGQPTGDSADGEEEMHITIGDSSVTNYYTPPAAIAGGNGGASNAANGTAKPATGIVSYLGPALIGAATTLGGLGTGLALPQLLSTASVQQATPPSQAQVQQEQPHPPGITIIDQGKAAVEAVQLYKPGDNPPIQ